VALESPRPRPADIRDLRTLADRGRTYQFAGFAYDCGEESHYVDLFAISTSSFVHEYHAVYRVSVPYWAVIAITAAVVLLRIRCWRAGGSSNSEFSRGSMRSLRL